MIKDLQDILNIGILKNLADEVVEKDNERFQKNYQPRFKTTEDIKNYLYAKIQHET